MRKGVESVVGGRKTPWDIFVLVFKGAHVRVHAAAAAAAHGSGISLYVHQDT